MSARARSLAGEPRLVFLVLAVAAALGLFVVWPLGTVLIQGFFDDAGPTLSHLSRVVSGWHFVRPMLNSLLLGAIVAPLATGLGLVLALAVTWTRLPGRGLLRQLASIPIVTPPFVVAISAILLLGKNGLVTRACLDLGVDLYGLGFDVYGLFGLVLVETLAYFPTAFLVLTGVLASIDPALLEAASSLGASPLATFRRVTLPLIAPGLWASFLLVFIESLADFGNPLILGGRFKVLSVQAYLQITGVDDAPGGALLALVLLLPSLGLYAVQSMLLSRRSYVTVTGKPSRRALLPRSGVRLVGGLALLLGAVVTIFYGLVLFGSFVRLWGADHSFTLENYPRVLGMAARDLVDSIALAGIAAPLATALALLIAYLVTRRRFFGRRLLEGSVLLTFAVPGTVAGIGYALAFSSPPLLLTGTAAIIVLLFVVRSLAVGVKAAGAALEQIDPSLEEAAASLGASPLTVFRRVTAPLIGPAVFSSLAMTFVRSLTAVSAVIFVVSGQWNVVTVAILGLLETSELSLAAALSVVLVGLVLCVLWGMRLVVRRLFPGAVEV